MTYRDLVLADNPYVFIEDWPTVEGSGGRTLTPSNATYVDGIEGNAIAFVGTSVSYANLNAVLSTLTTFDLWYKPTANPILNSGGIISGGTTGSLFRVRHTTDGFAEFTTGQGSTNITSKTSFKFTLGQWHHIAFTRKSNGHAYLYVNGVQVGSLTPTGAGLAASSMLVGLYVAGAIDRLAIYNGQVLPESTILAHYDYGVSELSRPKSLDVESAQSTFIGLDATLAYSINAPVVGTASFAGLMATTTIDVKAALAESTWRGLDASRVATITKYIVQVESKTNAWTGIGATSSIYTDPYFSLISSHNPIHYWDNWPNDVGSKNDKSTLDLGFGWKIGSGINVNGIDRVSTQSSPNARAVGNIYNQETNEFGESNMYTVEGWFKPNNTYAGSTAMFYPPLTPNNAPIRIIRADDINGKDYLHAIVVNTAGSVSVLQRTYTRSTQTAVDTGGGGTGIVLPMRRWSHIAVTDDGKTYINGALVHTGNSEHLKFGPQYTEENATVAIEFGYNTDNVDNVAIYPARLTQPVIESHANFYNGFKVELGRLALRGLEAQHNTGREVMIFEAKVGRHAFRGLDAKWGKPPVVLRHGPVRNRWGGYAAKRTIGVVRYAMAGMLSFAFGAAEIATKTKASAEFPGIGRSEFKVIQPKLVPSPLPTLAEQIRDYPMFYAAEPSLNKKLDNFGMTYIPDIQCGQPDFSITGIIQNAHAGNIGNYFFNKDSMSLATGHFSSAPVVDSEEFGKSFKFTSEQDIVLVAPTASTFPIAPRSDMDGRKTRGTARPKGWVTEFWFKSYGPQDHMQMLAGYFYRENHEYAESEWVTNDDGTTNLQITTKYKWAPWYRDVPPDNWMNFRARHHYVFAIDTDGCLLFNNKPYYRLVEKTGYQTLPSQHGPIISEIKYMGREKIFIADNQWHHLAVTGWPAHRGLTNIYSSIIASSEEARDAMWVLMDGKILPFVGFNKSIHSSAGNIETYYHPFKHGGNRIGIFRPFETSAPFASEYPEFKWQKLHHNPFSFGNLLGYRPSNSPKDHPAYKVSNVTKNSKGLPIEETKIGFIRDPATGVVTDFIGEKWDPVNMPIHVARKSSVKDGSFVKLPMNNMWVQNTDSQYNLVGEMTNILVDAVFAAPIEEIQARYMIGPQITAISPAAGAPGRIGTRGFAASIERGPAGPTSVSADMGAAHARGRVPTMLIRDPMGEPVWMDVDTGKTEFMGGMFSFDLVLAKEVFYDIRPGLWNAYGLPTTSEMSLLTDVNASWSTRIKMPNKRLQPTLGGR